MRRPPFPFQSVLLRAEEERDASQREFFTRREAWRAHQQRCSTHQARLGETLQAIGTQRAGGPQGGWEQGYTNYAAHLARQLRTLQHEETGYVREVDRARRAMLKAALKVRVWESLRERFWQEYARRERRREESELEDWARANFNRRQRAARV